MPGVPFFRVPSGPTATGEFDDPLAPPIPEGTFELDTRPAPVRSVAPIRLQTEREEAEKRAQFGPPPEEALERVRYALRARKRKRVLAAEIAAKRAVLMPLQRRGRTLRVELGKVLAARADLAEGPLRPWITAARDTAGGSEKRTEALARVRGDVKAERAILDQEERTLDQELAPFRRQEQKQRTQVEVWQHDLKRAQAALARLEIEMRHTAGDPAARAPFQADYDARRADVTVARQRLSNEEKDLAATLQEMTELLERAREIQEAKSALDLRLQRETEILTAEAGTARERLDTSFDALATEALRVGLGGGDARKAIANAREQHAEATELAALDAALQTLDQEAYESGAALLVGAAVAALGVLISLAAVL